MPTTPPGADPEPAHPHPSNLPRITLLAGGIGGARFTRGLLGHLGARADAHSTGLAEVTVIGNNGDDIQIFGLQVCPDLDTVMYTLGNGISVERVVQAVMRAVEK